MRKFMLGLLFSLLVFGGITVYAESDGTYVYSITSNDTAMITGVVDSAAFSGSQTIPEKIGKYTITKIAGFWWCTKLTDISIPSSVTVIDKQTFYGCTGLTNITIPNSVTSIGESAFSGCSALEEITLPFIGYSRTAGYSDGLFGHIFGTTSYTGGVQTEQYYGSYASKYYIPSSLKKVTITDASQLSYGAFYNCTKIKEIVLNDKITTIGDKVFYNCDGLTSIVIPNSVTSLGSGAFNSCSNLSNVTLRMR